MCVLPPVVVVVVDLMLNWVDYQLRLLEEEEEEEEEEHHISLRRRRRLGISGSVQSEGLGIVAGSMFLVEQQGQQQQ